LAHAVAQDVREAQQDGQLDAACLEVIDQVLEVDGLVGAFAGLDGDVPALVDGEVALAPVLHAVHLDGVLNLPFLHQVRQSAFGHRSVPPKGPQVVLYTGPGPQEGAPEGGSNSLRFVAFGRIILTPAAAARQVIRAALSWRGKLSSLWAAGVMSEPWFK